MPHIQINGEGETFIVTHLDKISIASAVDRNELYSLTGSFYGKFDNGNSRRLKKLEIGRGYVFRIQCDQEETQRGSTFYFSASGTINRSWVRDRFFYEEQYMPEGIRIFDNCIVFHDEHYSPILSLRGEIKAQVKRYANGTDSSAHINGQPYEFSTIDVHGLGTVSSTRGMCCEAAELNGRFKLKPKRGTAKRDGHKPYGLKGDQEFVLDGRVTVEMGLLSAYGNDRATPSSLKIFADGELMI